MSVAAFFYQALAKIKRLVCGVFYIQLLLDFVDFDHWMIDYSVWEMETDVQNTTLEDFFEELIIDRLILISFKFLWYRQAQTLIIFYLLILCKL